MSIKVILYPFSKLDGELCSWVQWKQGFGDNIDWQENRVILDSLIYSGYGGGRSAMTMYLKSEYTGKKYPMFWKYFSKILKGEYPNHHIYLNNDRPLEIRGRFTFCKHGQNYGIKPVKE